MGKAFSPDFAKSGENALPIRLGSQPGSIPAIVQNFKSISSPMINKLLETSLSTIWHRNYCEQSLWDIEDYDLIVEYI